MQEDENFKLFFSKYQVLKDLSILLENLKELKAENDYGNVEYKLKLDNPTLNRIDHLTT